MLEYAESLDLWIPEEVLISHDGMFIEGLTVDPGYKMSVRWVHEVTQLRNFYRKTLSKSSSVSCGTSD